MWHKSAYVSECVYFGATSWLKQIVSEWLVALVYYLGCEQTESTTCVQLWSATVSGLTHNVIHLCP